MFAKKPISIFAFSLLGSLAITTYGLIENLIRELNPLMAFLFSINYLAAWLFGLGAIFMVGFMNHWFEKKQKLEKWHYIAHWILASIFLVNFLREFIFLFVV